MDTITDRSLISFLEEERKAVDNRLAEAQAIFGSVDIKMLRHWLVVFLNGRYKMLLPTRRNHARRLLYFWVEQLPSMIVRYNPAMLDAISCFWEWMLHFPDELHPGHLEGSIHACFVLQRTGHLTSWLKQLDGVAEKCPNLTVLLDAGKVAAWRTGVVRFRDQALTALAGLSPDLQDVLIGAHVDPNAIAVACRDRWAFDTCLPSEKKDNQPRFKCGGFVGFGGPFFRPPGLEMRGDLPVAGDGSGSFVVLFDSFGCELVQLHGDERGEPFEKCFLQGANYRIEASSHSHFLRIFRCANGQA